MGMVSILNGHEFSKEDTQTASSAREISIQNSRTGITSRGVYYRILAGRMAIMSGGTSIPDWWTPILTASWPNQSEFAEYPQDTENYNDIYATY